MNIRPSYNRIVVKRIEEQEATPLSYPMPPKKNRKRAKFWRLVAAKGEVDKKAI